MLATFSNEQRINDRLQQLNCPLVHFSLIANSIGRTRLTEAMKGGRPLEQLVAEKLLTVLDEMTALKGDLPVSPDWSDTGRIQALLRARRKARTLLEEENLHVV